MIVQFVSQMVSHQNRNKPAFRHPHLGLLQVLVLVCSECPPRCCWSFQLCLPRVSPWGAPLKLLGHLSHVFARQLLAQELGPEDVKEMRPRAQWRENHRKRHAEFHAEPMSVFCWVWSNIQGHSWSGVSFVHHPGPSIVRKKVGFGLERSMSHDHAQIRDLFIRSSASFPFTVSDLGQFPLVHAHHFLQRLGSIRRAELPKSTIWRTVRVPLKGFQNPADPIRFDASIRSSPWKFLSLVSQVGRLPSPF